MRFTAAALTLGLASAAAAQLYAIPILEEIAPKSTSCDDSEECVTAADAADHVVASFAKHKVYKPAQIAAVLSLMAFESGDFKYKRNAFPGRPGQGTANMQMATYNLEYARSISELADAEALTSIEGKEEGDLTDEQRDAVLDLVVDNEYNFGSGPWYLANHCKDNVRSTLDSDADAGYDLYLECVGVTMDDDRAAYWKRAKSAFNL